MKIKETATGVLLIVLTAQYGCKVDNIDGSEPTVTHMDTMEQCDTLASQIDERNGVRAICVNMEDNT